MTAVLLAAAGALLLWPGRTQRVRRVTRREGRPAAWSRRPGRLPAGAVPVLAAGAAAALGALAGGVVVAVLAGGCAAMAARGWLRSRAEAAAGRRLAELAEALGVLAAELRSGRSLTDATGTAAGTCQDETVGRALLAAVRAPGAAAPAPPGAGTAVLGRVSAAVALSARTGCSLAAVLAALEDDLRARRGQAAALRTAVAGPRASAAVLAGLPVLGLAMGSGVGADPWGVLTTTGAGRVLLVAGVGLEAAGVAWTGRLVRRALR